MEKKDREFTLARRQRATQVHLAFLGDPAQPMTSPRSFQGHSLYPFLLSLSLNPIAASREANFEAHPCKFHRLGMWAHATEDEVGLAGMSK